MKTETLFILAPVFTAIGFIAIIGVSFGYQVYFGTTQTGVCLFKGPASFGLFSSSDGIPIRGVDIKAWNLLLGAPNIFAEGPTDRTGCFTFQGKFNAEYFLSYTYNGTGFTESVKGGTLLRDNLP